MPLIDEEPKIDDRTFEEIYRDLRLRVPRYTKEWTNFNESDPGVTLLQLFAWLSEMILARANQVPRRNYLKFLKLIGHELRAALPATAHLTFFTKANQVANPIPARTQISAEIPDGKPPVIFETTQPLDLIQAPLAVVGVSEGDSLVNVTSSNEKPGTGFRPLGWFGELNSALYLGFEQLVLSGNVRPFPDEMTFRVFLPAQATAGKPQRSDAPIPAAPVELIWEYRERDGADWERLNVFVDESAAFTREGYIRVEGPGDIEVSQESRLGKEPRYWIRVRLESGKYPVGGPEIDFIRPNTVPAESLVTVRNAILGDSAGQPNTTFALPFRPVQPDSIKVTTSQNNGENEQWTKVDDFLASKDDDAHFILNATEGTIQFGNGERGRIPVASATVITEEFRYGGGARDSAGAGTIKTMQSELPGVDKVTNERAAVGGADEQSIDDLVSEAPGMFKRRECAITTEDFESYAKEAGDVVNVVALANTHPDFPDGYVAGAVTVIIVPDTGGSPPRPSSDLIASVCSRLNRRRMITTEVYVQGPDYREVRVEAFVEAKANASFDSVARDVKKAINKLLDPKTWVIGRDLQTTQIFREVLTADEKNIVGVKSLNVYVDGRPVGTLSRIPLTKRAQIYGGEHLVVVTPEQDS